MVRSAIIPAGSWPRRMPAAIAAGYCGELAVEAFLRRVGTEYPRRRVKEGRRQLWLRDDLDRAIAPDIVPGDLAEDLWRWSAPFPALWKCVGLPAVRLRSTSGSRPITAS